MTRALSTSVLAVRVISTAFSFTMLSVGRSFVGRSQYFASAAFIFRGWPAAERLTAQFLVATRLVIVRAGLTPAGNSAAMTPSPSGLLWKFFAVPPSHLKVFASVFW